MWKPLLILPLALLAACVQLTTNKNERTLLEQAAQAEAREYLECIRTETRSFSGRNVAADYVTEVAIERCAGALADYEADEYAHLKSMYMLPDEMLAEDIEELKKQARAVVADEMAGFSAAAGSAAPVAAVGAAAAASQPATVSRGDERLYLDCIESQANRFAALEESAETIAEVAHNRCASFAGAAALESRGRALALDTVFEARLPPADEAR